MSIFHHAIFLLALRGIPAVAQPVLINELQPACQRSFTDTDGNHPDWVELYGTTGRTLDLAGYTLSTGAYSHPITASLLLPAHGHLLLRFDGRPERGPDHIGLKLSREGGTLMLIAPDGSTVIDVFSWPALPPDVSIGRSPDGAPTWSFFEPASPGSANRADGAVRSVLPAPELCVEGDRIVAWAVPDAIIRYTMDGSAVVPTSPVWKDMPATPAPMVFRARAYASNALPGAEALLTWAPQHSGPWIGLAVDPQDLWGAERGLIGDSAHANYARSGEERLVPVLFELDSGEQRQVRSAGLGIAGSGTRGLAKRSFKLFARDRFGSEGPIALPGSGVWDELFLRADASPNAFLRNVFMERVVVRAGDRVDVQESLPVALFLNGADQGLYRAMPPKNGAWLGARHGVEAVELANGPGGVMLRGDRDHLDLGLKALLGGVPMDSLARLIDLDNLIELACLDLYMGRADHDLNVRCWRPRAGGGVWRWILFDMDLWAPPEENSLERMCSATTPEAPYLPQLLAHPELNPRLIARLEALLLTVLHPSQALPLADSLYRVHGPALMADDSLWQGRLQRPGTIENRADLNAHATERPELLIRHLAEREDRRTREVSFEAPEATAGTVLVEDLPLAPGTVRMPLLGGTPLRLKAVPAQGWTFVGWIGVDADGPDAVFDPAHCSRVRARFSRAAGSGQDGLQQ